MTRTFQTAVKRSVSEKSRREAIDQLVRKNERTALAVLVNVGGLRGEFRRRAVDGLGECGGTDQLEDLADDTSIEPTLRRRAESLL